jgi:hypothetical protein
VVVDLLAYADESGTHRKPAPRFCVVLGWIGSPRQWQIFDKEWNSVLDDHEVPDFHSSQFFRRRNKQESKSNPYRGWSSERATGFIDALTDTLKKRRIYPIGRAADVPDFMARAPNERRYYTGAVVRRSDGGLTTDLSGSPDKPYHFLTFQFLDAALSQAKRENTVHFIFDRNDQESGYATTMFDHIKATYKDPRYQRLGDLCFASRIDRPGLQAADLYAHLWHAYLTHGTEGMGRERNRVFQEVKYREKRLLVMGAESFEGGLSHLGPDAQEGLKADD